jgi:Putative DNA-binding domain
MPPADADLARLQHWLQRQIVGDAVATDNDDDIGSPDVIRGSVGFPARQRLAVYARGYLLRLVDCLREEFPVLRRLVGDQVFDLFASAYIAGHPSQSYSLYGLGAGFADFLEATRPAETGPRSIEAIPANLARLERAMSEAQRAAGLESRRADDVPIEALLHASPDLRLHVPDTVRLLHLEFDFAAALTAAAGGVRPDQPPVRETWVAVARRRYRVRAHQVTSRHFALLRAFQYSGELSLREAAAMVASATSEAMGVVLADLMVWLPEAIDEGICCVAT